MKENFFGIGNSKEGNSPMLKTSVNQEGTEGQVIKDKIIKTKGDIAVSQGCSQTGSPKQEILQETGKEPKHTHRDSKTQELDTEETKSDDLDKDNEGLIDDHAWE